MLRWTGALVAAVVLSGFALLLVTGHYVDEGPVIATFTQTHGLHQGDLFVLGGWFVGMVGVATAALAPRREHEQPVLRRYRTPSHSSGSADGGTRAS